MQCKTHCGRYERPVCKASKYCAHCVSCSLQYFSLISLFVYFSSLVEDATSLLHSWISIKTAKVIPITVRRKSAELKGTLCTLTVSLITTLTLGPCVAFRKTARQQMYKDQTGTETPHGLFPMFLISANQRLAWEADLIFKGGWQEQAEAESKRSWSTKREAAGFCQEWSTSGNVNRLLRENSAEPWRKS